MLFCGLLLAPAGVYAQHDERSKHIEAVKAAFITQKLDLTTSESQNFWPVYNAYQKELETLFDQKKRNREVNRNDPNKLLDNDLIYDERILEVKKKYRKKFAKVIPPQKIVALNQAEREFRERLIRQLKERKPQS